MRFFPFHLKPRKQHAIKEAIIAHLEEDWGKSCDDYRGGGENINCVRFAYDGLKIRLN